MSARLGGVSTDAVAAARRADILAWLPPLQPTGRTNGGEWHGPCPRCGGANRFMAWPNHPRGPRARCRQCHPGVLDAIALVQWLGLARTFGEAVALLAGAPPPRLGPAPAPVATEAPPKPYRPPWGGRLVVARYNYYRPNFYVETREDWHAPEEVVATRRAAHGEVPVLLYQKERWEPGDDGARKTFRCRHPRPDLGHPPRDDAPEDWLFGMGCGDERWPYNWPAALAQPPGKPLYITDGEKDVHSAARIGRTAMSAPDGGDTWREEWSGLFMDHPAFIIADGTPEGLEQARKTARLLQPFPDRTIILRLPCKDLTAWMEAGCPPAERIDDV